MVFIIARNLFLLHFSLITADATTGYLDPSILFASRALNVTYRHIIVHLYLVCLASLLGFLKGGNAVRCSSLCYGESLWL